MDKTFVHYYRLKNGRVDSDRMEEMWRGLAEKLMEGKEIDELDAKLLACCILDACDVYKEKNGSTANVYSEIVKAFGLDRSSGRQFSDEYAEADIYQAVVERMEQGEPDKKTGEIKAIGYKKAISKLIDENHVSLKIVKNTTPENIQRIYRKIDKMRKDFEVEINK